jgi:hypothetical protein
LRHDSAVNDDELYRRYRLLTDPPRWRRRRWIGLGLLGLFAALFIGGEWSLIRTSHAPLWALAIAAILGLGFGAIFAGSDFRMPRSKWWRMLPMFIFFFTVNSSEKFFEGFVPQHAAPLSFFLAYQSAVMMGFLAAAVPVMLWRTPRV